MHLASIPVSFKRTERRVRVVGPVTPCGASESILEEHSDDGHHRQASVGQLCVELFRAQGRVLHGVAKAQVSQTKVALAVVAWLGRLLVGNNLQESCERKDLGPALLGHHGDGLEAVGDISELQVVGWGEVAVELEVLWDDVPHCRKHGHTSVLDLDLTTTLEDLDVKVLGEPEGIPESERRLITGDSFEAGLGLLPLRQGVVTGAHQTAAERRVRVVGPVTPRGAREPVLEQPE